ncbi:MAG TPA: hypothetical protein ENG40_03350 [Thermoprotei archaeon]|nr:hypothetical protein [Thermoprotei archaeon]
MGVGKSRVDSRWRITLPVKARGNLKPGDTVIVEERGNIIILRKVIDPLKIFREVKLYLDDKEMMVKDAAEAKHIYGGLKE